MNLSGRCHRHRHIHHLSHPRRRRAWWWGTPRRSSTELTKNVGIISIKRTILTFLKVFCCLILFLMDWGAGEPIRRWRSGIWTSRPWQKVVRIRPFVICWKLTSGFFLPLDLLSFPRGGNERTFFLALFPIADHKWPESLFLTMD